MNYRKFSMKENYQIVALTEFLLNKNSEVE